VLDRQCRMAECENSVLRPMRFLRRKMFAHGDDGERMGRSFA
jgi:hypothetical protein